ncbi:MAG: hypothetical protein ACE14Q_04600 [Acidobacteriota bacterium]
MRKLVLFVSLFAILFSSVAIFSQELDPLLQLLVEKKVLTAGEAQQVQKEYDSKKKTEQEETKKVVDDATKSFKPVADALKGIKIGGTYFYSYQNGTKFSATEKDGLQSYNQFVLKRAYFDLKKEITPYLTARFTTDVHQDSSGSYLIRMKYLYGDFNWKGNSAFSKPHIEVGMCHTPWLDFSDYINPWRVQDTLFIERQKLVPSADLGFLFMTNFGPELPKSYQDDVSKGFPGKWGSLAIGLYNGGGYGSAEKNTNKMWHYRVSFRPIPAYAPGLQLSIGGANGKSNIAPTNYDKSGPFLDRRIYPDFKMFNYMLSYQHSRFTLSFEGFKAEGNTSGSSYYTPSQYVAGVDYGDIFKGYKQKGYSYFGQVYLDGNKKWVLWGRYDHYDPDTEGIFETVKKHSEDVQKRYIYALAYKLYKDNLILLDYERLSHSKYYTNIISGDKEMPTEERLQLTLQIKF